MKNSGHRHPACHPSKAPNAQWLSFLIALLFLPSHVTAAGEPATLALGKASVWTGEPVELYLTIRAPGPFSGVANFDIPESSGLYFLKAGNPVVGSEIIEGSEFFTQRHKWLLFSQRAGIITIPPIHARYDARRSYTGPAEPFTAESPPGKLEVKRPPGFEPNAIVVTTPALTAEQAWSTPETASLETGDAVVRTITRKVADASAMLLSPIEERTDIPGVHVSVASPEVTDHFNRGALAGTRIDRVTYQFTAPGVIQIPALEQRWWNPETDRAELVSVPGRKWNVAAAPLPPPPPRPWWEILMIVVFSIGALWALVVLASRVWQRILKFHHAPERVAARSFLCACQAGKSKAACEAMFRWEHLTENRFPPADYVALREALLSIIYDKAAASTWDAPQHAKAFKAWRSRRKSARARAVSPVPPLNPVEGTRSGA